jgi:adenylate cyclase
LRLGWSADHSASIAEANRLYLSASSISDSHPDVLALGAYVKYFGGDPVAGKTLMRRAVELAPESAEIIAFEGALLDLIGDFEAAVTSYKLAISKSPFTPAWIAANLALTLLAMGEDVQAEKIFKQVIKNHPNYARAWIGLTVAFVRQKKSHEAQNSARTLLDLDPRFTVEEWASSRPFKDAALLERFVSDLRKAGLH